MVNHRNIMKEPLKMVY